MREPEVKQVAFSLTEFSFFEQKQKYFIFIKRLWALKVKSW